MPEEAGLVVGRIQQHKEAPAVLVVVVTEDNILVGILLTGLVV